MADWVRALDWVVLCSNPAEATYFASELWQFRLPRFASLSEETLEAVGPFYLVSMPREVTDPTSLHCKCVTCRGLHIVAYPREGQLSSLATLVCYPVSMMYSK